MKLRWWIAALLLAVPSGLAAQLDVQVLESTGDTVASARVELWSETRLIAQRAVDWRGIVSFTALEAAGATEVQVRSIGYRPKRSSLARARGRIIVRLERIPLTSIDVISVPVEPTCPKPDQPAARALWRRVAARYREPSLEGRRTELTQLQDTASEAGLGVFIEGPRLRGARAVTAMGLRGALQQIADSGYVYPLERSHNIEILGGWRYPALDAELAGHFASVEFGDAHTFALAGSTASFSELQFCARDRRKSGLDGTLYVSDGDGFRGARWRYWNPLDGAEAAGGHVAFKRVERPLTAAQAAADGQVESTPEPLVATSGLFWRKLPSGLFVQRSQWYIEWRFIAHDDGGLTERPLSLCQPPPNYVLCSASSVGGAGGSILSSCNSMPYRCFDD